MSLDVYLLNDIDEEMAVWTKRRSESISEAGTMVGLIPLIEEYYDTRKPEAIILFEQNITHNLGKMAAEVGIYEHLWRPEEINAIKAFNLIEALSVGLHELSSNPEKYDKLNPSNGWGKRENLVEFVRNYLKACSEHLDALIKVSR